MQTYLKKKIQQRVQEIENLYIQMKEKGFKKEVLRELKDIKERIQSAKLTDDLKEPLKEFNDFKAKIVIQTLKNQPETEEAQEECLNSLTEEIITEALNNSDEEVQAEIENLLLTRKKGYVREIIDTNKKLRQRIKALETQNKKLEIEKEDYKKLYICEKYKVETLQQTTRTLESAIKNISNTNEYSFFKELAEEDSDRPSKKQIAFCLGIAKELEIDLPVGYDKHKSIARGFISKYASQVKKRKSKEIIYTPNTEPNVKIIPI